MKDGREAGKKEGEGQGSLSECIDVLGEQK